MPFVFVTMLLRNIVGDLRGKDGRITMLTEDDARDLIRDLTNEEKLRLRAMLLSLIQNPERAVPPPEKDQTVD